jgi:hypothetical protein
MPEVASFKTATTESLSATVCPLANPRYHFGMKAGRLIGLLTSVLACGSNSSTPEGLSSDASHDSATLGPEGSSDGGSTDAAASDSATDAIPMCSGFSSPHIQCSLTCYGECAGLNAGGVADPSNHIGNCFFTASGNVVIYCVQWDAADPCSLCP